jgi:hypothetical protein
MSDRNLLLQEEGVGANNLPRAGGRGMGGGMVLPTKDIKVIHHHVDAERYEFIFQVTQLSEEDWAKIMEAMNIHPGADKPTRAQFDASIDTGIAAIRILERVK